MAIKERKQITGTTAQINAYEGHEGQIVWDKEKKTLVGMSGIAGTNYPLAPQAYVDTQLTEGLAGKEDKGVCLPLTGGLLSGFLELDPNFGSGNIDIGFNYDERLGSGIGFRSINYETDPGAFSIFARDLTQTTILDGRPDGTLKWADKPIVYQVSIGDIPGSGHYIRYSDGTQICADNLHSSSNTTVISYPLPFTSIFATITDGPTTYATEWGTTTFTAKSGGEYPIGYFSYFAIGTWK